MSAPGRSSTATSRSRRTALAAGATGAIAIATAAIALSARGDTGAPPQAGEARPVAAVEPAAAGAFGVLRRPQNAADVIPGEIPAAFSQASGANIALARRVVPAAGVQAWIIPGAGTVCILAQAAAGQLGGAVCNPAAGARRGGLDVQSANAALPGEELLAGLVPDGVSSVAARLSDGSAVTLPVRENVYAAVVHAAVASVRASVAAEPLSIPTLSAAAAGARGAAPATAR